MLPSNLLVAKVRNGYVEPQLLEPEGLPLAIAAEILDRIRQGVGKGRKELEEELRELEELAVESGIDLRLAKAMVTLALRKAKFEPLRIPVDPVKARLEIFKEAGSVYGIAVRDEERVKVLQNIATRLNCRIEDLELLLTRYQDEVLIKPPEFTPVDLVRECNLSMVQTLLFRAMHLDVWFKCDGATVKWLLRTVKKLGLLYIAEEASGGVRLLIDGPVSLLKQTRRYGTRLARLIPYVMLADSWLLLADIEGRRSKLKFKLNSSSINLFPRRREEVEPLFDSNVEREFFKSISRVSSNWVVKREPEPLVAGKQILIPDFSVSHRGNKVYIEIVGFWTKDYLERKLRKLKELKDVRIIVAVDRDLSCSSIEGLPHEVVLFRRRIRGVDLYPVIKRFLNETEKTVEIEEKYTVDVDNIGEKLPDLSGRTLEEAVSELEKAGVRNSDSIDILEKLGYTVEWETLDPSRARVKKIK
ncbi:MAG: DUF790 family protein [Thermofilaceae archaeon]|nr:DUF790 family protein [Thermofilaceae archaeon]